MISKMTLERLRKLISFYNYLILTLAYSIIRKEIEFDFSEFNKIGAKNRLKTLDKC